MSSLAGGSHAFLRLFLAVEETLHQPLRLAGQEGLPEHADAEIDGLGQRQFLPLAHQRLLRAQDLRTVLWSLGGGREATRRAVWTWLVAHYDAVVARVSGVR